MLATGRSLLRAVRSPAYRAVRMEWRRALSEAECYARCYGWVGAEDTVKVLPSANLGRESDPRLDPSEAGERLRRLLELRLDAREAEAA